MNIIDATPPANLPDLIIVMDREVADKHCGNGIHLRIKLPNNGVDIVRLENESTLPGAVSKFKAMGFEPKHYMFTHAATPSLIPEGAL
ncbi:hypothetical protein HNP46_000480 [Pseudomonas nitritireducens]|uniref:Uncharacterized protein n=1 Tax=Pseudomonas nitroreducens TaxID=46680 RepID=A0A7W7KG42_PSENT|nr:hypothetical protein [Pseudomonas nitritireducens]MBB4861669.1 hypothetical protein [Pseudomonas nitritireducens]